MHSAQDVVARPGDVVTVPGKFTYGIISKDLEGADVDVWLHDCRDWRPVASDTTDLDGRSSVRLHTSGMGVGSFAVRHVVPGDASVTESTLQLLPAGTQLVVFDIDGTLTTGDEHLVIDVLDALVFDGFSPPAYAGAAALTQAWAAKGYVPLYLTGRPYLLTALSRRWLADQGFAPGLTRFTDAETHNVPSNDGVGAYKREQLRSLQAQGFTVAYAYGNATTDVFAYGEAGIARERTVTIGEHAGLEGTVAVQGDYEEHLAWVAAQPSASPTFAR